MKPTVTPPAGYASWLAELKARIANAQRQAVLAVNREQIQNCIGRLGVKSKSARASKVGALK